MAETNFRKLIIQIRAIAPMCNFEMPEVLCNQKELFCRFHYAWMNEEVTSLVNLASGVSDD